MIGTGERVFSTDEPVVQPVVRELLRQHEVDDSLTRGTVVGIATISPDDPYEKFDIDTDRIINSSRNLIERVASTKEYHECIAIAVELPSDDIFVDLFTYNTASSSYESVESLAMALNVDVSSVHHLIGEKVQVVQENDLWVICEHLDTPPVKVSVAKSDFLNPLVISGLLIPLGALFGWHTTYPIEFTTILGILSAALLSSSMLYLTLAAKRDHPLPGFIGRLFMPNYTDGAGTIEPEDGISDVQHGEFERLITLANEDEHDSARAVLYNLAVVVNVPPVGEKVVPLPAPTSSWHQTTVKKLIYRLSSSVETLDRSQGVLIPLHRVDGRIAVDGERLSLDEPSRDRNYPEKLADSYVKFINSFFGVGDRDDVYR